MNAFYALYFLRTTHISTAVIFPNDRNFVWNSIFYKNLYILLLSLLWSPIKHVNGDKKPMWNYILIVALFMATLCSVYHLWLAINRRNFTRPCLTYIHTYIWMYVCTMYAYNINILHTYMKYLSTDLKFVSIIQMTTENTVIRLHLKDFLIRNSQPSHTRYFQERCKHTVKRKVKQISLQRCTTTISIYYVFNKDDFPHEIFPKIYQSAGVLFIIRIWFMCRVSDFLDDMLEELKHVVSYRYWTAIWLKL